MNLEEIRQVVAFMKENGVCELSYTEKNASVSLKLAPPPPPHGKGPGGHPWKEHKGAPETEENPFEPDYSGVSVEFYDDGDEADEDNMELKKAAKAAKKAAKAAVKEARAAAKEAAKAAKAAVKKATDNVNTAAEQVDAEEQATEAELDELDAALDAAEAELDAELDAAEAESDAAEAQPEEKGSTVVVTIDTESIKAGAKEAADKVTDAVVSTAKIGMELGKQGLQYLKDKRDEYLANSEASKTTDAPVQQPEEPEDSEAPIEIEITLEDDSQQKDEE
ncbi:MAG: TolC family protein [Clostridiales bacterium]|nr:TolC family protein [Clostridiales bacterium]